MLGGSSYMASSNYQGNVRSHQNLWCDLFCFLYHFGRCCSLEYKIGSFNMYKLSCLLHLWKMKQLFDWFIMMGCNSHKCTPPNFRNAPRGADSSISESIPKIWADPFGSAHFLCSDGTRKSGPTERDRLLSLCPGTMAQNLPTTAPQNREFHFFARCNSQWIGVQSF